jgi:hypothetical protein
MYFFPVSAIARLPKAAHYRIFCLLAVAISIGCTSEQPALIGENRNAIPSEKASDQKKARLPLQLERKTELSAANPGDWFEDVTASSQLKFAYRDGSEGGFYQLLESVGGGAALLDYDSDGDLDVFITGGGRLVGPPIEVLGHPCALFRNDGDCRFVEVTAEVGLADSTLYTHGCIAGDYDNDGRPDLFVAGFGGCRLYHNAGSRFVDVTEAAGLHCPGWNVTGVWADFDRDGKLDLYVVTYAKWQPNHLEVCRNDQELQDVCGPTLYPGARDHLFRNLGDGRFEEVTDQAGLVEEHRGLGVVAADLDENGWVDFYVVNDVQENQLYMNGPDLPFSEQGVVQGAAYSLTGEREGSMGVDVADFDGDGLPDLWYTNYTNQDNSLLRNTGENGFVSMAPVTGLVGVSRVWVGFGTALADFDQDSWPDLFIANGHVAYERRDSPYYQPAQLFKNEKGKRFDEVSNDGGPYFSVPHSGRGAAVGDLDNDGALDIVVVHQNDPVTILRNRNESKQWVRVRLTGRESNRDGIGAKVSAPYGDRTSTTWVRGGSGYASSFDPRVLIPQPVSDPVDVKVVWPSGKKETFEGLQQGETHELVEGQGRP